MTSDALEHAVLEFVNGHLLRPEEAAPVTSDDRLFEDGHLDSVRVLELVAFLEQSLVRKLPDRAVRLANFRSVRAIARAFGSDARPAAVDLLQARYQYHTTPERFASPIAELRRRGELTDQGDGGWRLDGVAARLFEYFDCTFAHWGRELGADDVSAPDVMELATLERAGFLGSFPQLLVPAPGVSQGYAPAACYHRYAQLAEGALAGVTILGVHARCRRAECEPAPLERCIEFTMREVVALGTRADVERVRHRLVRRVDRFVTALALDGVIEPATDPFFAGASEAQALTQRAGELKLELRLTLEGERSVAAASFNRHHDYFGRRFAIALPDGSPAHSGCIAFGIERWVLAFLTQHGFDERTWPRPVRGALEIRRAHAALS